MNLTPEQLRELARATLHTRPDEIGCDDWLARVGAYLELALAGRPIPDELRPVGEHLDLCPECAEEFEAMKAALGGTPGAG